MFVLKLSIFMLFIHFLVIHCTSTTFPLQIDFNSSFDISNQNKTILFFSNFFPERFYVLYTDNILSVYDKYLSHLYDLPQQLSLSISHLFLQMKHLGIIIRWIQLSLMCFRERLLLLSMRLIVLCYCSVIHKELLLRIWLWKMG